MTEVSTFHCPFSRLIVFQNAINYMHTFTHFTLFFYDCHQIHCIFLWNLYTSPIDEGGKRSEMNIGVFHFQYNVPAPRAKECCNELGVCRWDPTELPAEVYQDPELSKKLVAVMLMFCGCRLCALEGPCVSQTAGDCGELHAIGSLELGLCSGGSSPFFMIFFIFDLLFWNQILTWKTTKPRR